MTKASENYNSASEKDVNKEKRLKHNDTQAEINDLRATMKTQSGRNTVWRLLTRCGVFQGGYNPDSSANYYKEGKRDVGLYYIHILHEHCFELYQKMQSEQLEKTE